MGYVFNGIPCKTSKHERQNMITIALLVTTNTNHLLSLSTVIVDWHCGPSTRAKLAKGAMELLIVDHVYFSGQRCDVAKDTYRCRHRCLGSKHFVFESVKSKSKEALCGQHPDFKVDDHPHFVQGKRVAMCGFEMKVLLLAMMMSVCGIIGIVDSKSVVSLVLSVLSLVLCHLPLIRIWKQIKLVLNIIGKAKIGVVIGSESRLMDLNCFLSWPVRIVSVSSSGAHLGRVQPLDTDDKWDKWIKSECTYGQSLEKNSICDVLHHNLYC
eukprot:644441_1